MSTEPGKRERPAPAPPADGTGEYLAEAPDATAEAPPEPAPRLDATAVCPPAPADATGVHEPQAPAAPELTEVLLRVPPNGPAPAGETGEFAPADADGATREYDPEPTRAPGGAWAEPEATGVFVPGLTDAGDGPAGRADPAGVTNEYVSGVGPAEGGTGDFDPTQSRIREEDAAADLAAERAAAGGRDGEGRCGRYVLRHFHARGGMGEIWLAEDPGIGRSVALKRMLSKKAKGRALSRFLVEAQITGQLEHPGIVPVHELGTTPDGRPYYAMKFVRGETLKKIIEDHHAAAPWGAPTREVEDRRLLQTFIALCQTVGYAHSRGVLHRDLKPENVMMGPYGETLVLDWGIAKVLGKPDLAAELVPDEDQVRLKGDARETGTQVGSILGSPSYMAPEVAAGKTAEVDVRSDVYLLGATLYEILTGKVPRKAETVMQMIQQAQREPPVAPRRLNANVPRPLDAICRKAMAREKEDRYQTALELAEDVQRYLAGEAVTAYRESFLARAWRWVRRHRKALARGALAAVAVAVVVVLVVGALRLRETERLRQEAAKQAAVLQAQEQARQELAEFRRLADEMHLYAASADSAGERAPYFDPRKADATGQAAWALAEKWGAGFEGLAVAEDDRAAAREEAYALLLQMAQLRSARAADAAAVGEMATFLDRARPLREEPTRSYYRLLAQAHGARDEGARAVEEQRRADDPTTPTTALDHFLLGERYRQRVAQVDISQPDLQTVEANRASLTQAVREYRQALQMDPRDFWSSYQLGRCHLQLKQGAEAVEALTYCVALRPELPWGYTMRGFALAELNRYAEAEEAIGRAMALDPEFLRARLSRGVLYWLEKKEAAALADLDAVLAAPERERLVEAAFYRAQIYLQQGKVDQGLQDLNLVVKSRPDFRPAYQFRALVFLDRGDDARALQDLDTYLSLGGPFDPQSGVGLARRARLLRFMTVPPGLDKKRTALALADLRGALDRKYSSADLFDDLGAMLEKAGRVPEAVQAYTKGLEQRPKDVFLLNKRAWAWEALNQHDRAQKDFRATLDEDPNNAEAHAGLGYVYAVVKQTPEAQREADLAVLNGADRYGILHNVACIYATLSAADAGRSGPNRDAALALVRKAVELSKQRGEQDTEMGFIKHEIAFPPEMKKRLDEEFRPGGKP